VNLIIKICIKMVRKISAGRGELKFSSSKLTDTTAHLTYKKKSVFKNMLKEGTWL